MTIPYERSLAVARTRELLKELAAGERIDADILRHRAKSLLKHFPGPAEIESSASKSGRLPQDAQQN